VQVRTVVINWHSGVAIRLCFSGAAAFVTDAYRKLYMLRIACRGFVSCSPYQYKVDTPCGPRTPSCIQY
jgi:hypothetical protein